MDKKIIVLFALLALTQKVFGLTPIGTPSATLDEGKYEAGFSYFSSDMDVKVDPFGLGDVLNIKTSGYMPTLDIGLGGGWQFSLGLGVADIDAEGIKDDNGFGGLGIKKTLFRQGDIDWGASIQIYWSYFDDEVVIVPTTVSVVDLSYHEIQIAFGPTYRKGDLCIYGGPFLHYLDGEIDVNDFRGEFSSDIERDLKVGGFVGISTKITKNIDFGFEAQFVKDAEALVFRFRYRF